MQKGYCLCHQPSQQTVVVLEFFLCSWQRLWPNFEVRAPAFSRVSTISPIILSEIISNKEIQEHLQRQLSSPRRSTPRNI